MKKSESNPDPDTNLKLPLTTAMRPKRKVKARLKQGWHKRVPWAKVKASYLSLRKRHFASDRPRGRYYRVRVTPDRLTKLLGEQYFAPNGEFSYYYRGEEINLARVEWDRNPAAPRAQWWQTHVRGWRVPPGKNGNPWDDRAMVDIHAHYETEPTENADAHLNGDGLSVERGMAEVAAALDTAGLQYDEYVWTGPTPDGDEPDDSIHSHA